jgi:cell division protein FtsI/penicillin-binding protein 2
MKNWRFYLLVVIVFFCFSAIVFRLFTLQVLKHSSYQVKATNQQQEYQEIYPIRGEIYMQDIYTKKESVSSYFPIAINKDFYKVYAVPKDIKAKEETASLLAPFLNIDLAIIQQRINKIDDPYEPLKDKVDGAVVEEIKNLNLEGIKFEIQPRRYFPSNETACHLIGFVRQLEGEKSEGQYGVEESYQEKLSGKTGLALMEKDSKGQFIPISKEIIEKPEDGADLLLTIDSNIQIFAEQKLGEYINTFEATGGSIVVMEVKTGKILAMASSPKFDPNNYGSVKNIGVFMNSTVQSLYEPGSVFKPITMAAALDKGVINPQTTYNDTGKVEISGKVIENALRKGEGIQTMTQALEKSLNTGAVFAQQQLGKDDFKEYVEKFGFADKTGIDLNGEVRGNTANLETKRDFELANISFGQGIAVTPIQLVVAFGALANDGILMRPYVVDKIIYPNNKTETTKPLEIRRVVSSDTASRISAMLVSVVKNGHTQRAGVDGYLVAAKTGTAQIPDPTTKKYLENETIHTVLGFFPAFNAKFSMIVRLDKPNAKYAESTAAPLFGEIAKYILNYYEIPPSE